MQNANLNFVCVLIKMYWNNFHLRSLVFKTKEVIFSTRIIHFEFIKIISFQKLKQLYINESVRYV